MIAKASLKLTLRPSRALLDNRVPEGRTLEYKSQLPDTRDEISVNSFMTYRRLLIQMAATLFLASRT